MITHFYNISFHVFYFLFYNNNNKILKIISIIKYTCSFFYELQFDTVGTGTFK